MTRPRRSAKRMLDDAETKARTLASGLVTRARWSGEFDGDMRRLYAALRDLAFRANQHFRRMQAEKKP